MIDSADWPLERLAEGLAAKQYLTDRGLFTAVRLAVKFGRPQLLEGEPGVGKSTLAGALAAVVDRNSFGCSATRAHGG